MSHRPRTARSLLALVTTAALSAGALCVTGTAGAATSMQTPLPLTATWRYNDAGKTISGWERAAFDDSTWKQGAARLGYAIGGEATVINRLNPTHTQDFFRGRFQVTDRTQVTSVSLSMLADDGAVVYLNGTKVATDNMNSTGTAAAVARTGTAQTAFRSFSLPTSALVNGTNVLAVVLYQVSASDKDSGFAASVTAQVNTTTTSSTSSSTTSTSTSSTSTPTTTTITTVPATTTAPATTTVPATTFRPASVTASIGGCKLHPADHFLNATGVERLPVSADSAAWTQFLGGSTTPLKVGFGALVWDGSRAGMPMNVVDSRTIGRQQVLLDTSYTDKSYMGGYPVPWSPLVEGDPTPQWDKHVIMVDQADCTSYELIQYDSLWRALFGSIKALAGARVPLNSTTPVFTTNAAQTPMVGQNVLVAEANAGRVDHVIGFCTTEINPAATWPARLSDGKSTNPAAVKMGAWFRLRAGVDMTRFTGQARAIVDALRTHGAVLTDTCGLRFGLMGENSSAWNDKELAQLGQLTVADLEAVNTTAMKVSDTSWQIR